MSTDLLTDTLITSLGSGDLSQSSRALADSPVPEVAAALDRLPPDQRALAFRLLGKETALRVFEAFDVPVQSELIRLLADDEVTDVFTSLDPDDRVQLLDESPATVAAQLIRQLPHDKRRTMAIILGYPRGSVGRRMSPEFVHVAPDDTLAAALERVLDRGADSETIYTVPVVGPERVLVGVITLRRVLLEPSTDLVADHMVQPVLAFAHEDAEEAAFRCVDSKILALPVVDREHRLLGLLTIDDATEIVEEARDEDAARAGASERLRRPYLQTPVRTITRSRIVWLMVLGISAILTVNVLELFEATLQQRVALALFIPLLTGIGGNTGSQAATTVTRALALGEARPRSVGQVAFKEARTGLLLGLVLGLLGFTVASLVYGIGIGSVIGLTLICVCIMAATVGGTVPLIAKTLKVDPAVFSTPFISTFCDATGLIIYFTIAQAVLGL